MNAVKIYEDACRAVDRSEITLGEFEKRIEPLKDVESVVRCKDCKYWLQMNRFQQDYHPGRGECELNCWVRDYDWFCSDGERR